MQRSEDTHLPLIMEGDDLNTYLNTVGPKIGTDLAAIVHAHDPAIRSKLVALKDFEHVDPSLGCPMWRIEVGKRLKGHVVARVLDFAR